MNDATRDIFKRAFADLERHLNDEKEWLKRSEDSVMASKRRIAELEEKYSQLHADFRNLTGYDNMLQSLPD